MVEETSLFEVLTVIDNFQDTNPEKQTPSYLYAVKSFSMDAGKCTFSCTPWVEALDVSKTNHG